MSSRRVQRSFPAHPGIQTSIGRAAPAAGSCRAASRTTTRNPVTILESRPDRRPPTPALVPDDAWQIIGENTGASTRPPPRSSSPAATRATLTYVVQDQERRRRRAGQAGRQVPQPVRRYRRRLRGQPRRAADGLSPWDSKDKKKVPRTAGRRASTTPRSTRSRSPRPRSACGSSEPLSAQASRASSSTGSGAGLGPERMSVEVVCSRTRRQPARLSSARSTWSMAWRTRRLEISMPWRCATAR